ncbi:Rhodanese-like domain-containing protein [Mariannaea sp. PMI_226]|nr:Rhodanese-like domain-containing protein [Mariannaea sp. PMI_226]
MQPLAHFRNTAFRQISTMATIASLRRISAKSLSERMLEEKDAKDPTFAVIDVRDSDYIGGHIKGGTNIPTHTLDAMMPTLVRKLKDKKTVVFHCLLSQQRGPGAALQYLRERDGLLKAMGEDPKGEHGQEVVVLDKGFLGWQEVYGSDERLTEGYVKDLWDNY